MDKTLIIGVMGGGNVSPADENNAYILGKLIAENRWILLNGGRNAGIMDASAKGAKEFGGLTIGILPGENLNMVSPHIDIPILTGMGSARNCINVLSSDIIVACPGGPGTISEIALALKYGRPVILLNINPGPVFKRYFQLKRLHYAKTPEQAVKKIIEISGSQAIE